MDETPLYRRIAEQIRQEILTGKLKPGDRLSPLRQMSSEWNCTVGTIQRAYQELARQGLVTSRSGQGTRVAARPHMQGDKALRRAGLVHRAEAFLLEALTAGYSLPEVEAATRQAMDRWRTLEQEPGEVDESVLRFSGSHDLALTWLAGQFSEIAPGYSLQLRFTGSLGGLMALAEGRADLAGSHLWDADSGAFNAPYVRRLFPGKRMALLTLAHRRIGLILPEGNPQGIQGLEDLTRPGLRFANRQEGSGTRVWLDAALRRSGISPERIDGYAQEARQTHSAVAQAVAEGRAQAGIGLEAAALSFGLDFVFLTHDRYDLVAPEALLESAPLQALQRWLKQPGTREQIRSLGGYDTAESGELTWVE